MSDPTILVLSSLAGGDKHGYGIMLDVETFAGIKLGPGTLYGAITRLEERGWIAPTGPRDRRQLYTITPEGKSHLQTQLAGMKNVVNIGEARLEKA